MSSFRGEFNDRNAQEADRLLDYIKGLRRDALLLSRHLARRSDRMLSVVGPNGISSEFPALAEAMNHAPEEILRNPAMAANLATVVDVLSQRVSPANVTTICLTGAFMRITVEAGEPPAEIRSEVSRIRRWMGLVAIIAGFSFVVGVLVLAHVDDGRRAIQQLEQARQRMATTNAEIQQYQSREPGDRSQAAPDAATALFRPLCAPPAGPTAGPSAAMPGSRPSPQDDRRPQTARQFELCNNLDAASRQVELIYIRLAQWNARTTWLPSLMAHAAERLGFRIEPIPEKLVQVWQATEIRVSASLALLAGFVLPMLMGCLGGCAYVLRRLDQNLKDWTLEPRDGFHGGLRALLGAIIGGLVGVVWSSDSPVLLGGVTLSLAALAFVVGFGLEVVLSLLETMIESVASKLRPATPISAPPAMPTQANGGFSMTSRLRPVEPNPPPTEPPPRIG